MNRPVLGIVSGSGIDLHPLFDTVDATIPFTALHGPSAGGLPGHALQYLVGTCAGRRIIVQSGRRHFYEGWSFGEVTSPVETLRNLGAATVLLTCAAGGLSPNMMPGDSMAIESVRLFRYHGWRGHPQTTKPAFTVAGCAHMGAYAWVHGPCYETRAEIALMQAMGIAAVGMSIAPELMRCRELGIPAAGIAFITNNCCLPRSVTHAEVVETAHAHSRTLVSLIRAAIEAGQLDG